MNKQPSGPGGKRVLTQIFDDVQFVKKIWETASWAISAGGTVMAFVNQVGGPWQFFVEVFAFGFACYIAAIPAGFVWAGVEWLLAQIRLQPTDKAAIGLFVVLVLGLGLFVRSAVFQSGVTKDLDAIGSAFAGLVGIAILLTPVFLYLRRYRHHFVQPVK